MFATDNRGFVGGESHLDCVLAYESARGKLAEIGEARQDDGVHGSQVEAVDGHDCHPLLNVDARRVDVGRVEDGRGDVVKKGHPNVRVSMRWVASETRVHLAKVLPTSLELSCFPDGETYVDNGFIRYNNVENVS